MGFINVVHVFSTKKRVLLETKQLLRHGETVLFCVVFDGCQPCKKPLFFLSVGTLRQRWLTARVLPFASRPRRANWLLLSQAEEALGFDLPFTEGFPLAV